MYCGIRLIILVTKCMIYTEDTYLQLLHNAFLYFFIFYMYSDLETTKHFFSLSNMFTQIKDTAQNLELSC